MDTTYRVTTELGIKGSMTEQLNTALAAAGALDAKLKSIRGTNLGMRGTGAGGSGGGGGGRSLEDGADALKKKFGDLKSAGMEFGSSVGSAVGALATQFTGLVETAGSFAMTMGKVGAGIAAGGIVYATHLNAELEKTQISLAAIFGAQGVTANMGEGMGLAANMMKKIRADAAALPGETEDLINIFRLSATPGLQAGMDVEGLEALSAKVMAAAASTGMDMHQAAREFSMLLQGRAGAHNVLGLMLPGTPLSGEAAQKFNKSTPEKRVEVLTEAFNKFGPSIATFGTSWDALWSTGIDNAKLLGTTLTGGLFSRLKDTLGSINKWVDEHKQQLLIMAEQVGDRLSHAFETAKSKMIEWWPTIKTFTENVYKEIVSVWDRIEPAVVRFGETIKRVMSDPDTMKHIEQLVKLYAVIKIGTPVMGAAAPIAQSALGLGRAFGGLFGGAGGGAAAGAGAAEGGVMALIGGGGAVAGGAIAAGVLAEALFVGWGAMDVLTDKTNTYHATATAAWANTEHHLSNASSILEERFNVAVSRMKPVADAAGIAAIKLIEWGAWGVEGMARNSEAVMIGISSLSPALGGLAVWFEILTLKAGKLGATEAPELKEQELDLLPHAIKSWSEKDWGKDQNKKVKGGGGTVIQKVEITVASNQDPNRIARSVKDILAFEMRARKASPYVRNYASSR